MLMHLLRLVHSEESRRLVSLCTLCALLFGAIGVPMPRLVTKDQSQPFPCQRRACGCMDAASCWKSCCCHSNREKVAWAKDRGVEIPDFVVVAAEQEGTLKTCCTAKASEARRFCDVKKSSLKEVIALRLVIVDDARKCQGKSSLMLLLSQVVAEIQLIDFDFRPVYGGLITPTSDFAEDVTADRQLQPPRSAI